MHLSAGGQSIPMTGSGSTYTGGSNFTAHGETFTSDCSLGSNPGTIHVTFTVHCDSLGNLTIFYFYGTTDCEFCGYVSAPAGGTTQVNGNISSATAGPLNVTGTWNSTAVAGSLPAGCPGPPITGAFTLTL
jgi:ribosomal protein S27E